ncbi:MAG: hypothetical protein KJO10_07550, partial [Gammaproteobacteria bacterium]|nr:hypothetical protein [Gammaproteobacteria bacterium]
MMKMFNMNKSGASNSVKIYSFILFCALGAMVWTFVKVDDQTATDQSRIADVSEQLVLSQQMAKYALAAITGDTNSFEKMGKSRNTFSSILDKQMGDYGDGSGASASLEGAALVTLDNRWHGFRYNINAVLDGQFLIMAMAESTTLMSEVMPQLMEHTQDVVDILVKQGATSRQVKLAANQAVLGQRIVNSLNDVMTGNETESAAIMFAADTKEFGRVLDGFMRGTNGISKLKGKTLQDKMQKIALLFSRVSDNAGSIVENADELVTIQAAAREISGQSEALFSAASELKSTLSDVSRNHLVRSEMAYVFGAIALLMMFFIGFDKLKNTRQRSYLVEDENTHNQEAIMRLLDEMGDLASGDLTVHTTVTEDFTG